MTPDPVGLSAAQQIDAACDAFETAWRNGTCPRIEDYLDHPVNPHRLQALLVVEAELRRRAGEQPCVADYSTRFPTHLGLIEQIFPTVASVGPQETTNDSTAPRPARSTSSTVADVPTHVGRFEVLQVLGEGAFGRVYKARDPHLHREVAIKVPRPDSLKSPIEIERFLKEARASATVTHPNICPVHEVGEHDGRPFIVMALVPGVTLSQLLEQRTEPMPERQAILTARKLALALEAAHAKGVIHRDLKPANIVYDRERKELVVMDFGLARRTEAASSNTGSTRSGVLMGTPAYMSPEQAAGRAKEVGPASDVWALGVILYEMLAGRRPFGGTLAEVLGQILYGTLDSPSYWRPGLDPRLEAIVMKALTRDLSVRYASMKAFADDLAGCLKTPSSATEVTPPLPPAPLPVVPVPAPETTTALLDFNVEESPLPVAPRRRKMGGPRWLVAAGLLGVVGVLLAGVVIIITGRDGKKTTVEVPDGSNVSVDPKGTVNVSLPKAVPPANEPANAVGGVTQRQVAEWVASMFGDVDYTTPANQNTVQIRNGTDRGKAPRFPEDLILGQISIRNQDQLTDADMNRYLGSISTLEKITLRNCPKLTSATLEAISRQTNLKLLFLEEIPVTDDGTRHLAKLVNLQQLHITKNPQFRGENLGLLASCSQLYELWLDHTGISSIGLQQLARLDSVTHLHFWGTLISNADAETLARMKNLTALGANYSGVSDRALETLATCPSLRLVGLAGTRVSAATIQRIQATRPDLKLEGIPSKDPPAPVEPPKPADPSLPHPIEPGFVSLFDGKTLDGWDGDPKLWRVENGMIVGETPDDKVSRPNDFLKLKESYQDFELRFDLRLIRGNTGVIIRGRSVKDDSRSTMAGPQVDLADHDWGTVGTEPAGPPFLPANRDRIKAALKPGDFNALSIAVKGKHVTVTLNGQIVLDGEYATMPPEGLIALQVHGHKIYSGMRAEFRNLRIKGAPLAPAAPVPVPSVSPVDPGWLSLFDGKSLDGWTGDAKLWRVADGTIIGEVPAGGISRNEFLYRRTPMQDYELQFQVRMPRGNSGIQVRSALSPPGIRGTAMVGPQVELSHKPARFPWGSLVTEPAGQPSLMAKSPLVDASLKPNDFNTMSITVLGQHLSVTLNGTTVTEGDFPTMPPDGLIAFQLHQAHRGMTVELRDIRLRPLTPPAVPAAPAKPAAFVPLFDGQSLAGWQQAPGDPGRWSVVKGVLVGQGPHGSHLFTTKEYDDFHLRAEAMINATGNSGIYIRAPFKNPIGLEGYEAQINVGALDPIRTGSLYKHVNVLTAPHRADEWFAMEMIAQGKRVQVLVNGKVTADYTDPAANAPKTGRIALQMHDAQTRVQFRTIEIAPVKTGWFGPRRVGEWTKQPGVGCPRFVSEKTVPTARWLNHST